MKLGELIAIARECKGWTLRQMEAQCGVSNALISQIERGHVKDPGLSTMIRMVDALGLSWERVVDCARPYECATCRDNPMVCASIPGLRHCARAMTEEEIAADKTIIGAP